jgi:hypothetical protein
MGMYGKQENIVAPFFGMYGKQENIVAPFFARRQHLSRGFCASQRIKMILNNPRYQIMR